MRTIICSMLLLLVASSAQACDICQIYIGMRPNDLSHRIGINYRNRILRGELPVIVKSQAKHIHDEIVLPAKGENLNYLPIEEYYQVAELRVDYSLSPLWMVRASLPYLKTDSWINQELTNQVNGLGDPWIRINRIVLSSKQKTEERALSHRLRLGIGVKFPLGKTRERYNEVAVPFDMQPGSGSYDYLGSLEYMMRFKSFGFSASGVYKYNTSNLSGYRFGNTAMMTSKLFALMEGNSRFLMPYLAVFHEMAGKDSNSKAELHQSGGSVTFVGSGMELGWKNISLEFSAQLAVHDHLKNSIAPARQRFTAGFNYFIKSINQ